jgi:hypothetical protein
MMRHVAPGAGGRAVVIPCAIQPPSITHVWCGTFNAPDILRGARHGTSAAIAAVRVLSKTAPPTEGAAVYHLHRDRAAQNYPGLIAAREQCACRPERTKVIVGQYGWSAGKA